MAERQPDRLAALLPKSGSVRRAGCSTAPPTLAFAVIGQARAEGKISPEEESRLLADLLTYWALRGTLDMSERVRFTGARQDRGAKHFKSVQPQEELCLTNRTSR